MFLRSQIFRIPSLWSKMVHVKNVIASDPQAGAKQSPVLGTETASTYGLAVTLTNLFLKESSSN